MHKVKTAFANAFKPSYQYKRIISNCYPKDPNSWEVSLSHAQKLTVYALTNPEKVSTIGKRMQKVVTRDLNKRKYGYAEVGARVVDELITACHGEIPLFSQYVFGVVNVLLNNENLRLKIQATETLKKIVPHIGQSGTGQRDVDPFIPTLINFCIADSKLEQDKLKIRIAGFKALSTIIKAYQSHAFDFVDPIMRAVLINLKETITESDLSSAQEGTQPIPSPINTNVRFSNNNNANSAGGAGNRSSVNMTNSIVLPTTTWKSLNEPDLSLSQAHLKNAALECLIAIARVTTATNIATLMKPFFEFIDAQNAWTPNTFAKYCLRVIILSLKSQYGFLIVNQLIYHFEKIQSNIEAKIGIIEVISFVIDIQRGVVGPRSLEALSSLIKHLLAIPTTTTTGDNRQTERLQNAITEGVGRIARRGQHTTQNIDMMVFILGVLRDSCAPEDHKRRRTLLRCVLMVSAYHPSELPAGKNYPDVLVTPLLELLVSEDPESRSVVLQILQRLISKSGDSKTTTPTSNMSSQSLLNSRQIQSMYSYLYKSVLMKNNEPSNFEEIYKMLRVLLNEYKGKNLKHSIPAMFRIQRMALEDEKIKAQHNLRCINAIHALIAAYLLMLAREYNDSALENHVLQVVRKREESGEVTSLLTINPTTKALEASKQHASFSEESTVGCAVVNPDTSFKREVIVDMLANIESLKQTYGETITEVLSRDYDEQTTKQPSVQPSSDDGDWWKFYSSEVDVAAAEASTAATAAASGAGAAVSTCGTGAVGGAPTAIKDELDVLVSPYISRELFETDGAALSPNEIAAKSSDYSKMGSASVAKKRQALDELDAILDMIPNATTAALTVTPPPPSAAAPSLKAARAAKTFADVASTSGLLLVDNNNKHPSPLVQQISLSNNNTFNLAMPRMLTFDTLHF